MGNSVEYLITLVFGLIVIALATSPTVMVTMGAWKDYRRDTFALYKLPVSFLAWQIAILFISLFLIWIADTVMQAGSMGFTLRGSEGALYKFWGGVSGDEGAYTKAALAGMAEGTDKNIVAAIIFVRELYIRFIPIFIILLILSGAVMAFIQEYTYGKEVVREIDGFSIAWKTFLGFIITFLVALFFMYFLQVGLHLPYVDGANSLIHNFFGISLGLE